MSTFPTTRAMPPVEYPTGDGQPVGETPDHRDNLLGLIQMLRRYFAGQQMVYISGNMFIYYVPGRKRRHVSPDVFVVKGIPNRNRDAYFVWEEGKGPDFVVEFTSASTCDEDLDEKLTLYRDTLGVREYFLFDPKQEYLNPPMQGYRLEDGEYVAIEPVEGRLPSEVLGLELERDDVWLRLYDPSTRRWVPTPEEVEEELQVEVQEAKVEAQEAKVEAQEAKVEAQEAKVEAQEAKVEAQEARAKAEQAEAKAREEASQRQQAEAKAREALADRERLLRELERLRGSGPAGEA